MFTSQGCNHAGKKFQFHLSDVLCNLFSSGASEYRHKLLKEAESANDGMLPGGGVGGMGMMKTVIIAVCSAGAYLALVIGLTAFCSYRLLMQRRTRKAMTGGFQYYRCRRRQKEMIYM